MKTSLKLFALGMLLAGFGVNVSAQVSATATTTATIVTPIAIEKNTNMNFGNVAVSPTTSGTVVLATDGARTKTDGVTLPATAGTITAAKFTVTGAAGYTYAITLPTSVTLSDGASHSMTVNAFTSNPTSTGSLVGGTQDLYVGATLNVSGAQAAGLYTNASGLTVTVNYN